MKIPSPILVAVLAASLGSALFPTMSRAAERAPATKLEWALPIGWKHSYHVHAAWTSSPNGGGEDGMSCDLVAKISLEPAGYAFAKNLVVWVTQFKGRDLTTHESKHLKEIASSVDTLKMRRGLPSLGGWTLMTPNSGGWAGMLALESLGLTGIGFLDLNYAGSQLKVGAGWTQIFDKGESDMQSGNGGSRNTRCIYTIKRIDRAHGIAELAFQSYWRVPTSIPNLKTLKITEGSAFTKESGSWIIRLQDGSPVSYNSVAITETRSADNKLLERDKMTAEANVFER
ncbi:MAG TPA: hypothetical protein VGL56_01310 [Fimbriimonadaceae bacterium]|jgi:hypothetical protein